MDDVYVPFQLFNVISKEGLLCPVCNLVIKDECIIRRCTEEEMDLVNKTIQKGWVLTDTNKEAIAALEYHPNCFIKKYPDAPIECEQP